MWRYAIQPELEDATIFNQKLASVTSNPETDFVLSKSSWSERRMRVLNAYFTTKYFGLDVKLLTTMISESCGWDTKCLVKIFDRFAAVDIKPISLYFDYREECRACMRCQNSHYMLSPWTMWVGINSAHLPESQGCRGEWSSNYPGVTGQVTSASRNRTLIGGDRGEPYPVLTWSFVKHENKYRMIFSAPIPDVYMTTFTGQRTIEFDNIRDVNRLMVGLVYFMLRQGSSGPGINIGLLDQGGFAVDFFKSDKWQQSLNSFVSSFSNELDATTFERKTRLTELSAIKIVQENYSALITEYTSIGDFMTATFPGKTYIEVASQCFKQKIPEAEKAKEVTETALTEAVAATPAKKTRKKKAVLTGVEEDVAVEEESVPTAIRAEVAVVAPAPQPA
jgi:hypothetical protein